MPPPPSWIQTVLQHSDRSDPDSAWSPQLHWGLPDTWCSADCLPCSPSTDFLAGGGRCCWPTLYSAVQLLLSSIQMSSDMQSATKWSWDMTLTVAAEHRGRWIVTSNCMCTVWLYTIIVPQWATQSAGIHMYVYECMWWIIHKCRGGNVLLWSPCVPSFKPVWVMQMAELDWMMSGVWDPVAISLPQEPWIHTPDKYWTVRLVCSPRSPSYSNWTLDAWWWKVWEVVD